MKGGVKVGHEVLMTAYDKGISNAINAVIPQSSAETIE